MKLAAEISLYPLAPDYIPIIEDFISRLNTRQGLEVVTNSMSTQIFGDYDTVMEALKEEMKACYAAHGKAVFVVKFLSLGDDTEDV
jgi:uncharacterized protein YqgV (UPF0045/DUF77 family)